MRVTRLPRVDLETYLTVFRFEALFRTGDSRTYSPQVSMIQYGVCNGYLWADKVAYMKALYKKYKKYIK